MMKRLLLTTLILCFSIISFSQGFLWNDTIAKEFAESATRLEKTRSSTELPISSSLEQYVPQVYNQEGTSMCVAYALSSCRTILYAKNKEYTSTHTIKENAFSPYFIYYHTVKTMDNKCIKGLSPGSATKFMEESGVARIMDVEYPKYYPFTNVRLCAGYPENYNDDVSSAKAYKIDGIYWLTNKNEIKSEIDTGRAVCFSFPTIPPSFYKPESDMWDPNASVLCYGVTKKGDRCKRKQKDLFCYHHIKQKEISSMGHAMVIIGYDDTIDNGDGAFRILNSWGEEWGDNGKLWIKYNDFFKYVGKSGKEWDYDPITYSIHRKSETR